MLKLFQRNISNQDKVAVVDPQGRYTYSQLNSVSNQIATFLLGKNNDLAEKRVAFIITPGFDYVITQWGIWKAGGIAVPLCIDHPAEAIEHVLKDAEVDTVITHEPYFDLLKSLKPKLNFQLIAYRDCIQNDVKELPEISVDRKAMILYTSGTTSKPKGVVTTFENIEAQVTSLTEAWEWSSDDYILNVLPLHHVHGIINVMTCALWTGATVEFLPKFDPKRVFDIFLRGKVNVFMAVPTIYFKLINYYNELGFEKQVEITQMIKKFRLMVSGSAALPVTTLEKWKKISGHTLLERYGMTEIGMALSNPYKGERRPGHVGLPLPGVEVRLINEEGELAAEGSPGEIQIKGKNVFSEYWQNSSASKEAFDGNWFKSGDIAIMDQGYYKILGRNSVDIIKSGGYKISALEIEEVLLENEAIQECAVVGLDDEEWGEIVSVGFVTSEQSINIDLIRQWLAAKLPKYKVPRIWKQLDSLPRNALGKVTKNELKKQLIK